jgi:hypothetical protein
MDLRTDSIVLLQGRGIVHSSLMHEPIHAPLFLYLVGGSFIPVYSPSHLWRIFFLQMWFFYYSFMYFLCQRNFLCNLKRKHIKLTQTEKQRETCISVKPMVFYLKWLINVNIKQIWKLWPQSFGSEWSTTSHMASFTDLWYFVCPREPF